MLRTCNAQLQWQAVPSQFFWGADPARRVVTIEKSALACETENEVVEVIYLPVTYLRVDIGSLHLHTS